jgi:putative membrane protein
MAVVVNVLIAFIALLHLYFLYFEMFAWQTIGKRVFNGFDESFFAQTKGLAANQGLYNGFLAAGLIWTFFIEDVAWRYNISLFFLCCVLVAGLYGAYSADKKIFFVQGLPALITILLLLLG